MNRTGSNASRLPVTVLIPSFNEEKNIHACLESVTWADEILIVDSFSTDRTLDIAREFPVRILQHEYINSAEQKNWAIPQAKHEWVLIVDCDERVSPELKEEIQVLLRGNPQREGYWIRRSNFLFGQPVTHSGWGHDRVLRLFRRDKGRYRKKRVHAQIELNDTGELNACMVHYSIDSMSQWITKIDRYSTWKSQDKLEAGFRVPMLQSLIRPEVRFFNEYVIRGGFLDGYAGFLIAAMSAISEFLMSTKVLTARQRSRKG
ncbi:glycosyltransferase family 2 protein [bacterium]|nr:glycosyltransferase family 2 protein [candidate division CSSED10-310 bacterium]